jgi:hypothetical protein
MRYSIALTASVIFFLALWSGSSPAQDQPTPQAQPSAPTSPEGGGGSIAPQPPSAISPAPVNPGAAGSDAQPLRERVKAARQDCLQQARGQGLRGPALQQQVESCFAAKMPDVAKRMACRREAMSNGIDQGEIPAYVRRCLAKQG